MKTYCIVCRNDTENKNPKFFKTKNGRLILKSTCQSVIIKNQGLLIKIQDLVYYQILESELLCQKYLC